MEKSFALFFLAFTGLLFHLVKALAIALPSWGLARAELVRLREKWAMGDEEAKRLLQEVERTLGCRSRCGLSDILCLFLYGFFWNGSREMAAWRLIHGVERKRAEAFSDAQVLARLKRGLGELPVLPKEKAEYWRELLEEVLKGVCKGQSGGVEERRALLQNFLADLYDARDTRFIQLLTLHNKATYLFWLGLGVAGALIFCSASAAFIPRCIDASLLFVAGFGGGFLSRLRRVVHAKELPTDYGAYWASLFLSPIFGGLAALLGVLVLELAIGLRILGEGIQGVLEPPAVYGLGVVLGFSEQFFQGLSQSTEQKLLPKPEKGDQKGEGSGGPGKGNNGPRPEDKGPTPAPSQGPIERGQNQGREK